MTDGLIQTWRSLAVRERRMVLSAGVLLLAALVYLVGFEPAWKGSRKLAEGLPVLRAQAAQLGTLALEARSLSAAPRALESPEALQASLLSSTRAAGFGAALSELKREGSLFELRFKGVSHDAWLLWLDASLRHTRLRVADLSIQRDEAPGAVSVKLVLESPGNGQ